MAVTCKEMGAPREWIESLRKWMCGEKRSEEGNSRESHPATGNWAGPRRGKWVGREEEEGLTEAGSQEPRAETISRRKEQSRVRWATELSSRMTNEN